MKAISQALFFLLLSMHALVFSSFGKKTDSDVPAETYLPSEGERVQIINEVRAELESIKARLDQVKKVSLAPLPVSSPEPKPVLPQPPPASSPREKLGMYVVPSLGLFHSSGLEWKSITGANFEIEEKLGGSLGLRAGRAWESFFAGLEVTYARGSLKAIDLGGLPLSFSGDSEFLGFHFGGGGRLSLLEDFKLPFGMGIGGVSQEISMTLAGIPVSDKDFLLTYHLFTGIEYHPSDSLVVGLRYRFVNVAGTNAFSERDMQLIELSLGYHH